PADGALVVGLAPRPPCQAPERLRLHVTLGESLRDRGEDGLGLGARGLVALLLEREPLFGLAERGVVGQRVALLLLRLLEERDRLLGLGRRAPRARALIERPHVVVAVGGLLAGGDGGVEERRRARPLPLLEDRLRQVERGLATERLVERLGLEDRLEVGLG